MSKMNETYENAFANVLKLSEQLDNIVDEARVQAAMNKEFVHPRVRTAMSTAQDALSELLNALFVYHLTEPSDVQE